MRTLGIAALVTTAWCDSALAQDTTRYYHHDHMWGGMHGWFFGPIMLIAFIALIVALVVLLVKWLGGSSPSAHAQTPSPAGPTPMDILKERFAKGEIDAKEYEAKRKILEG